MGEGLHQGWNALAHSCLQKRSLTKLRGWILFHPLSPSINNNRMKELIMRKKLKSMNGCRMRFGGCVDGFGSKVDYTGVRVTTLMMKNVYRAADGVVVTNHLWFTLGKAFADLRTGDLVEFDARVADYQKGYGPYECKKTDYMLECPTKIKVIYTGAEVA